MGSVYKGTLLPSSFVRMGEHWHLSHWVLYSTSGYYSSTRPLSIILSHKPSWPTGYYSCTTEYNTQPTEGSNFYTQPLGIIILPLGIIPLSIIPSHNTPYPLGIILNIHWVLYPPIIHPSRWVLYPTTARRHTHTRITCLQACRDKNEKRYLITQFKQP